jgi:cation diffusion facilitator family transporter
MHTQSIEPWVHDHTFGQDKTRSAERRTLVVIFITSVTMVAEIVFGTLYGSMALFADGLHMGTHAAALAISAFAYYYTRRHAADPRFTFGTGKVNSLAGFASAVLLAGFALPMAYESVERMVSPVPILFDHAIVVAVAGFAVNGLCLLILGGAAHGHDHSEHGHSGHHAHHRTHDNHAGPHDHSHDHESHSTDDGDHNLRSAYLHVLADALTSVLAIFALLAGKYYALWWLDPTMGVVGALLIVRWSLSLLKSSGRVLLDMQAPSYVAELIRHAIEKDADDRVADLHVWSVGPNIHAAEIAVVSSAPRAADEYSALLPTRARVVHATVEVHRCCEPE